MPYSYVKPVTPAMLRRRARKRRPCPSLREHRAAPSFTKPESRHGLAGIVTRVLLPISREPMHKPCGDEPVGDEGRARSAPSSRLRSRVHPTE